MKRSEMITNIGKWLGRDQSTMRMDGTYGQAKVLLAQLEKWGMLPPKGKCCRRETDFDGREYLDFNVWELENDN